MTTAYPGALDNFTNPSASTSQNAARTHSQQHGDLNDAVEAIEAALGITGAPTFPGQLRADLANTASDKGAALVGFQRTGGAATTVGSELLGFYALTGTPAANGLPEDGIVVTALGANTLVRKQWWDFNEVDLRWFSPAVDGVADSASAITDWYTAVNALAAVRGRCRAVVPDIGVPFKTSVTVLMASGFILTGGGLLECHSSMAQGAQLLKSAVDTLGLGLYAQEDIVLDGIRLSGGNRNLTIGSLQALVRIYCTKNIVVRNVEAYGQQSHLLAFLGCDNVTFGDNVNLHDWGHPSNGIAVTGAVDNGSGLIRLTVTSTATMTTGDTRHVSGVEGVTNANGTFVVTVIDATHVDLQASVFAGVFSGSSTAHIASGVDGGSAVIFLENATDGTDSTNVKLGDGVYIHDGNWCGIQMNAVNFVVDGVSVINAKEAAIFSRNAAGASPSADGIITNCHVKGVTSAYIDGNAITAGSNRMRVTDNLIENCAYAGISLVSELFDGVIENNTVINGNNDPVRFPSGGGIVFRDALAASGPTHIRIANNKVRDIQTPRKATAGIRCLTVAPGTTVNDVSIVGNTLKESSLTAGNELLMDSTIIGSRWTVKDNIGASRTLQTDGVLAASAVAVPLTGTTNETVLATIPVLGRFMKANSRLEIETLWSHTNSANNKLARVRLVGSADVAFMGLTITTAATTRTNTEISNRNSLTSQIAAPSAGVTSFTGYGTSAAAVTTGAVDTAQAFEIRITGQLASAGETLTLESYRVRLVDVE